MGSDNLSRLTASELEDIKLVSTEELIDCLLVERNPLIFCGHKSFVLTLVFEQKKNGYFPKQL
jgi:hypothetical protein